MNFDSSCMFLMTTVDRGPCSPASRSLRPCFATPHTPHTPQQPSPHRHIAARLHRHIAARLHRVLVLFDSCCWFLSSTVQFGPAPCSAEFPHYMGLAQELVSNLIDIIPAARPVDLQSSHRPNTNPSRKLAQTGRSNVGEPALRRGSASPRLATALASPALSPRRPVACFLVP